MSTPPILDPSNVRIAGHTFLPVEPPMEPGWVITKQDFLILLEGPGAEKLKTACYFWVGIAATALVGLIGAVVSLPAGTDPRGWPLVFLILLAAGVLASIVLSVWFGVQGRKEQGRQSFVHCKERIEAGLKSDILRRTTAFGMQSEEPGAGSSVEGPAIPGQRTYFTRALAEALRKQPKEPPSDP